MSQSLILPPPTAQYTPIPLPILTEQAHLLLSAIVSAADDAILSKTLEGIITTWNPAAERIFGYSAQEIIGKPETILFPQKRLHEEEVILERLRCGIATEHFETVRLHKDGTPRDVSVTISPIRDGAAQVIGTSTIARDITERKRIYEHDITERKLAEAALQQMNEELKERVKERMAELARSNEDLQQFAYVASHDLQEPLRMVGSYTHLLARRYQGQLDAKADKYIAYVEDGVTRMQTLIQDLLTYSRVGTQERIFQETNLNWVLDRVLANLSATVDDSSAMVMVDPLPTVLGDETQLVSLFQNLIGNALKYRRDSPPSIHISATQKGAEWLFAVQDNGIGIDPQFAQRIFIIFQRLHGRAEYSGTGIGLAICKKIVECHKGRIWVESETGKGSTFLFTLQAFSLDRKGLKGLR